MAKDGWIPLHIRIQGETATAEFLAFKEEPSPGLRAVFEAYFTSVLGEVRGARGWMPISSRWAHIERATGLGVFPAAGHRAVQDLSMRPAIELVSVTEFLFRTEYEPRSVHALWCRDLNAACVEARFAWTFGPTPPHSAIRRMSPGIEALVNAASKSATSGQHLIEALRMVAGTQPNPGNAIIEVQKAVEAAMLRAFGSKAGVSLGMLVGELRKKQLRLAVPRSFKAEQVDKVHAPLVDPSDMVRGLVEAVHFGNPQRHAGSPDQPATVNDALSLLGMASLIVDWLERGQIVPTK